MKVNAIEKAQSTRMELPQQTVKNREKTVFEQDRAYVPQEEEGTAFVSLLAEYLTY